MHDISLKEFERIFTYNPETGILSKVDNPLYRPRYSEYLSSAFVTFSVHHLRSDFDGPKVTTCANKVAFYLGNLQVTGKRVWPGQVINLDNNPLNLKFSNLRAYKEGSRYNPTDFDDSKGVRPIKGNKFVVRFRNKHCGTFNSWEEALLIKKKALDEILL